jgi:hypothetical protein
VDRALRRSIEIGLAACNHRATERSIHLGALDPPTEMSLFLRRSARARGTLVIFLRLVRLASALHFDLFRGHGVHDRHLVLRP